MPVGESFVAADIGDFAKLALAGVIAGLVIVLWHCWLHPLVMSPAAALPQAGSGLMVSVNSVTQQTEVAQ